MGCNIACARKISSYHEILKSFEASSLWSRILKTAYCLLIPNRTFYTSAHPFGKRMPSHSPPAELATPASVPSLSMQPENYLWTKTEMRLTHPTSTIASLVLASDIRKRHRRVTLRPKPCTQKYPQVQQAEVHTFGRAKRKKRLKVKLKREKWMKKQYSVSCRDEGDQKYGKICSKII